MKFLSQAQPPARPLVAWSFVALIGFVAPATAMLLLANAPGAEPLALAGGPILAIALMGAGMIGAAADGRFWIGVFLAVLTGVGLLLFARAIGIPTLSHVLQTGIALIIGGISFAARGALFARSASSKGWWIAVFVVAGEAAILITAAARPGALPEWLLALLPAQWTNIAIQTALTGSRAFAACSALIALAGTAVATLLVFRLWPRRWPYLVMFTAWLGFSALVYHRPAPPMPLTARPITPSLAGEEMSELLRHMQSMEIPVTGERHGGKDIGMISLINYLALRRSSPTDRAWH
ncbi:hypothetical protein ACI5KX_10605 [Erythrobacter sp. GH1-10]|uniref:hypothetical protein n=1 Tax=Erythrobacter sp. GH1-10 TaxID=3349334 RepID=UPI003878261C